MTKNGSDPKWGHPERPSRRRSGCIIQGTRHVMNDVRKAKPLLVCRWSAANDLRQTLSGSGTPVLRHPVGQMFQRSAALASCCAGNPLLKHSATLELRCSGALLLKRAAAPACRRSKCSGVLLIRRSAAPLHRHPTAPASRCSGIVSLMRSTARALTRSSARTTHCSGNPALRDSAPCCLGAPPLECPTPSALWRLTALAPHCCDTLLHALGQKIRGKR